MSSKYPGGIITTGADTGYSVAFDGSGDYLSGLASTVYDFTTSEDFSVEFWTYLNSVPSSFGFTGGSASSDFGFVYDTAAGYLKIQKASVANILTTTYVLLPNRWYHIVGCRQSGTLSIFVNGVRQATVSDSTSYAANAGFIGGNTGFASVNGYMSNFRVVAGSSAYNPSATTLTVPTQLFAVPNTAVLTCQSPTLIDNSTNNFTITANGDAKVSNFTPFVGYKGFDPAMGAGAHGIWSIEEATNYQSNREWPIYDPYFNQTTLLLHGNGTNNANNNSFIDSSSNNFAITRNGNTTQGTFTPFSQTGFSYYFDTNSDEGLSYPTAANTVVGAVAGVKITYEFWVYCTGIINETGFYMALAGASPSIGVNGRWSINFIGSSTTSDQTIYYYWTTGTGSADTATSTVPLKQHRWNHIAICIDATTASSSTITIYTNGIGEVFTGKNLSTQTTANDPGYQQYIGGRRDDGSQTWNGYVRDFRVVRGSLVYTSNFTPPTKPLTAIPGTVLLTCQDNRFVDNSPYNWTMGAVSGSGTTGIPDVQNFTPYVPTVTTPTTYSNWFDGSGDYLTVDSSNSMFPLADFTMECWVYWNGSTEDYNAIYHNYNDSTNLGFNWLVTSGGYIHVNINGTSNNSTTALVTGRWYHLALVRSGSTVTRYINGVADATTVTIGTAIAATDKHQIGGAPIAGSGRYWKGVISNLRVLNYTAYTTNFTPSNAPLTRIGGTLLLTCQDSTFKDNSSNNFTITAYGNAKPVQSPTPYPPNIDQTSYKAAYHPLTHGGSAYFDGTGDNLSLSSTSLNLSSSDFTIETWIYATTTDRDCIIGSIQDSDGLTAWMLMLNNDGPLRFYARYSGGSTLNYNVGTGTFPTNSWNHVTVTRNGANLRIFLNGVQVGTTNTSLSTSSIDNASTNYYVGRTTDDAANFTGYLSGTRVLVGTALYTQNFAPPIAPPTPITNTRLLLNYTNAGIVDSTSKNVFETVGDAKISTTVSKFGGSSMYFDGTTDWLIARNTPNLQFGVGDFTIELWVYFNESGRQQSILNKNDYGQWGQWFLYLTGGNAISFGASSANSSADVVNASFGTPIFNAWNHIAVCRSGSSFKGYINGVGFTFGTSSSALYTDPYSLRIGANGNSSGAEPSTQLNGYIQDIRFTKGVARYTSNFIPQTSVWQNQ